MQTFSYCSLNIALCGGKEVVAITFGLTPA